MSRPKNRPNRHGVKKCANCKHELDIDSFGISKTRYDGRQAVCIGCRRRPGLVSAKEQIEQFAKVIAQSPQMFRETVVLLTPSIPMEDLLKKKMFNQWRFPDVCSYDIWIEHKRKNIF